MKSEIEMKRGGMIEMEAKWMKEVTVEDAAGLTRLMDWDVNVRMP